MLEFTGRKTIEVISVWVVDDNKPYGVILSEVINKSMAIRCEKIFTSARAAIAELETTEAHPNVILLDVMMPEMSGLDAIGPIFKASPETIIVMLTSMVEDDGILKALKRGAKGYILKSSTFEDIIRSIEQSVRGGVPVDPMVMNSILQAVADKSETTEHYLLSRRELEIIKLVKTGLSSNEIAKNLTISYYTVETHLRNIFTKLNVSNRRALIEKVEKEKLG